MTPKEYKEMINYLTRKGIQKPFTPASAIERPKEVLEIEAFKDFNERNPKVDGGRIGFRNRGAVITKDMQKKSAEAIKVKATKKLKDFVEKFKLNNKGQLPTQQQIIKAVGGKSSSIQKYLEEGVDYKKRITKQEAGRLAGLKSGEVRAVPEGQDPSYVKRAKTLNKASKFLSKQDAADFKKINAGKKAINKYFKSKPELINTTEFGKNIKQLLSLRMDKDTGAIFSKVRPDSYYIEKAKEGKLFDVFDIKAVKEGGKSLRFPTNINITPSQFNQVFIQSQVGKFFAKGLNEEAVKNVENLLKERNIRVKLPNVGYLGQDNPVAVDRLKGTFPKIQDTLKTMKAPKEILDLFETKDLNKLAAIGCPGKMMGGRIGLNKGQNLQACALRGVEKLKGDPGKLTPGDQSNFRALSKSAKTARLLKNVLGPAAILGEVLVEGGIAANKFMSEGVPIKQALGQSYLNYLLGPKTKIDVEAERAKEFAKGEDFAMAERGRRMAPFMAQGMAADAQRLKKREQQMEQAFPTTSPQEIDEILKTQGMTIQDFGITYPQAQDFIKQDQQMQAIADAGGVANLAGGGIAKEAGDPSGAMLESMNPDSQGLPSLLKRGRKG